jgi:phage shock protein A
MLGAIAFSSDLSRQCEGYEGALRSATAEVDSLQLSAAQLTRTISDLNRSPRSYFDEAVDAMQSDMAQDSDSADRQAISQLRVFSDRFPDDSLGDSAAQYIKQLEKRITDRDAAVQRAQAEVLGLVNICADNYAAMVKIGHNWTPFNAANRIDWNSVAANEAATEPYERALDKAKDTALSLLPSVPDPDGSLAKKVQNCGVPEDMQ